MKNEQDLLARYSDEFNKLYQKRKIILSFENFIDLVSKKPKNFIRDSSHYISDVFSFHGKKNIKHLDILDTDKFLLFELFSNKEKEVVGCEGAQNEIFHTLSKFKRKGFVDKLILLSGPSGSSKSLSIEKIASAMENYSQQEDGAVYKFNWIFPVNLDSKKSKGNFPQKIGFDSKVSPEEFSTFAFLSEERVLAKIQSEFKENPLFLIPMPYREKFLRKIIAASERKKEEEVSIPEHLLRGGLSKKNQEILDNMLHIYNGDIGKVFRHIQIERFFYSNQYRVGISSVNPQVAVDAYEKQITINENYRKLPPYLHDINFHESYGELVEANRGFIEYSDLLSRPLGNVKQLLNTIERGSIKLTSSIAQLDLVYIATTDYKHMDALKATPEFYAFRGRFEAITIPYLLRPSEEKKIYEKDLDSLKKELKISPHTLELLVLWTSMNRLKPAPLASFKPEAHALLGRLHPLEKIKLYEGESLLDSFTAQEERTLKSLRRRIWKTSKEEPMPEGRFGPSPRDIRALLHKTAQRAKASNLTPLDLFEELEEFIKQTSSYDYLQYEPSSHYHDQKYFLETIKKEYINTFEEEISQAMSVSHRDEYKLYLERYIKHVVAHLKGEKIWKSSSNSFELPSKELMGSVEEILKIDRMPQNYRSDLLNKIAATKIENPYEEVDVSSLFQLELKKIKQHFFREQRKIIDSTYDSILGIYQSEKKYQITQSEKESVERTFKNMKEDYGYSRIAVYRSVKFIMQSREENKSISVN